MKKILFKTLLPIAILILVTTITGCTNNTDSTQPKSEQPE